MGITNIFGGGGGVATINGTPNNITSVTAGDTVTLSLPAQVEVSGGITASTFQSNGDEILIGQGVTATYEKNRTFTIRKHLPLSTTTTGSYIDIVSWRPYVEGTTNDPAAASFWGAVSFEINLAGSIGSVGEGYRRMEGVTYYAGSSASSAAGVVNNTNGSVTDFRVNRVGWVSTLQYQLSGGATNFNGAAYVEIHFARGAGSNGNSIIWSITS